MDQQLITGGNLLLLTPMPAALTWKIYFRIPLTKPKERLFGSPREPWLYWVISTDWRMSNFLSGWILLTLVVRVGVALFRRQSELACNNFFETDTMLEWRELGGRWSANTLDVERTSGWRNNLGTDEILVYDNNCPPETKSWIGWAREGRRYRKPLEMLLQDSLPSQR